MEHTYGARRARRGQQGLQLVMSAAVLWGTVGVATQFVFGLTNTNPLSVGFWRLALATPLLALGAWCTLGRSALRIAPRDLGLMALIGGMLSLYQACFFAAIVHAGVTIATLVTLCTAPLMVAVLSALTAGERLTGRVAGALALALLGTTLLVGLTPGRLGSVSLWGCALALGSAFGYAVMAITSRRLAGRYHPLQINAVGFGTGAALLLCLALPGSLTVHFPPAGWLVLLYLGAVPSALGYVLFQAGIRTTPATVASIATLLEPLTAALLAWLMFGERLAPLGALGALLLLGALVALALPGRGAAR